MSLKAKVEAVLFLTSKPIKALSIARIVNADVQDVRQALLELVHDYEGRAGGLEIADDDGYSFQVRDKYSALMDEFMPIEMSAALIRTLSAIAIKQPICQSDIIRVRGAGAYDHIRELVGKNLVSKKEEQGERSPMLTTTKKFQEYFKLTKDGKDLRNFLKRQVRKAEAADAAADADEKQLSIPSVVSTEADEHLNQRIFLETSDDDDEPDILEAPADGALEEVLFVESEDNEEAQPSIKSDTQVESKDEAQVATTPVASPAATLSKLAEAAEAQEPALPAVSDSTSSKSSVQASTARKKEPKMANTPSPKPKPTRKVASGLSELLAKQKLLERQLKRGILNEADSDVAKVVPPVADSIDVSE